MNHSVKTGFSFGLTSAIITTSGLMVGLNSGTHSRLVVIGGILIIAVADSFSDSLGIHISEESENIHTHKEIWLSTISTFSAKFIFTMTFLIPVIFLQLTEAILVSIIWGLSLLSIISYKMAKERKIKPWGVIFEHLITALIVLIATNFIGGWISSMFK